MKKALFCVIPILCAVAVLCALMLSRQGNKDTAQTDNVETTQSSTATAGADSVEELDDLPQSPTLDTTVPSETVSENEPTQGSSAGENPCAPTETGKEQTKPSEPSTPSESTKPDDTHKQLTYAEYLALDAAGRQAYVENFPSMEEAMLWYESAKKAYDESKDNIDISNGDINLGDIMESMGK